MPLPHPPDLLDRTKNKGTNHYHHHPRREICSKMATSGCGGFVKFYERVECWIFCVNVEMLGSNGGEGEKSREKNEVWGWESDREK